MKPFVSRCALLTIMAIFALIGICSASLSASDDGEWPGNSVSEILEGLRKSPNPDVAPLLVFANLPSERVSESAGNAERFSVLFVQGLSSGQRASLIQKAGGTVVHDLWLVDGVAASVSSDRVPEFLSRLKTQSELLLVERDIYKKWIRSSPPVLRGHSRKPVNPTAIFHNNMAQEIPWGINRVNAPKAWTISRGGGVRVAIVDTGIDYNHFELLIKGGFNAIRPGRSIQDDNGHGTHVAGTVAALDNNWGVAGVAPEAALYGVKVLDSDGSGYDSDIAHGLQWCVQERMAVANLSLGGPSGSEVLAMAVRNTVAAGVAIVAAAGNDGGPVGYPAAYPESIAVAASDEADNVAYFSNRGPEIDFIAPGVSVRSTTLGGGYGYASGTSMASPHVTGLAVLAIAAHGAINNAVLRSHLKRAATKFPGVPENEQGAGMVDAVRLVSPQVVFR